MGDKVLENREQIERENFYRATLDAYQDAATARKYADTLSQHRDEFLHDYIFDFCESLPRGGRILDLGCGTGIDVGHLRSSGYQAFGIDVSEEMVKIATDRFGPYFQVFDARKLGCVDWPPFDAVMSIAQVLHIHPSDIEEFFYNVKDRLKKGGKLLVGTKCGKAFAWDKRLGISKPRANAFYDRAKMVALFESSGFYIEDILERTVLRRDRKEKWILIVGISE